MDDFRQLGPNDAAPSVYKRASALNPMLDCLCLLPSVVRNDSSTQY